jgi:hypothetical protein
MLRASSSISARASAAREADLVRLARSAGAPTEKRRKAAAIAARAMRPFPIRKF